VNAVGSVLAPGAILVAALLVGAAFWTLGEYVLHRWAFHALKGRGIGSREHLLHHVRATWTFGPVILWAWFGVLLSGVGWGALASWMVGPLAGWSFGAGWVAGYFFYEWHHAQAHLRAPTNRWEIAMRKHHFHHHFGHPMSNQGVTHPLFDVAFGTLERPERVRVPRRLAMVWLIDDDGQVRPEYRSDYELVGTMRHDERTASLDHARAFANLTPVP
jgi:sterol desaturase/sphingolipid hydroxylase (fatty acid hydroxylase superfamily)